jgi:enoyl-CoA hydratase/carnithine racemase
MAARSVNGRQHLASVLIDLDGPVVTITMNRPGRRNALSLQHLQELTHAFEAAGNSGATGIILAANGPVFCAGHDFADVAAADLDQVRALLTTCEQLMTLIGSVPQVVIARVHALATAAGAQLVSSCDLAVAADTAGFAAPGGKGGWFCHTPMVPIVRDIGRKRAAQLALTGDVIDAATALDWGLVNEVVPADLLNVATEDLLARATRGSAASKATGKLTLRHQQELSLADAYAYAIDVMATTSQTPDAREGMAAFLGKRPPVWGPPAE